MAAFALTDEQGRFPAWMRPDRTDKGIPAGWTRASWISRLRYVANRCEPLFPDAAAELRAEADRLGEDSEESRKPE